jgi:hypothetical protein
MDANSSQNAADIELPISEELERELIEAIRTPVREMTPADWAAKRRELIDRHTQAS